MASQPPTSAWVTSNNACSVSIRKWEVSGRGRRDLLADVRPFHVQDNLPDIVQQSADKHLFGFFMPALCRGYAP